MGHLYFLISIFTLEFIIWLLIVSSLLILYNVWFKEILLAHWPIVLFVCVCALLQCEWMYCVVSIHCIYFLCCVTNHIIVSCWIRREKRLSSPGCLDVPRMYGGHPTSRRRQFSLIWEQIACCLLSRIITRDLREKEYLNSPRTRLYEPRTKR